MGPIEITFLVIIVIFGAVGVVRGYHRELGVTLMLLLGLAVILFIEAQFPTLLRQLLTLVVGTNPAQQVVTKALIFVGFLVLLVFVAYQGETLTFPGGGQNALLSGCAGLLNGYLFAGSIWFFLAQAHWPFLDFSAPFTKFYQAALRLLPPVILDWRYLIILVAVLLILRVWR